MAVHLHRSERTDALLRGLAAVLTTTPDDPFSPDLVAVPTPGIERFITQGLGLVLGTGEGRSDGVCANVRFPSPSAMVNRVLSRTSGIEPAADPWLPDRAVWPLLHVIDTAADQRWCEPLARHLGLLDADPLRQDRRFAVARRLAGLFATYSSQRPQMLLDWATGRDTDGAGTPVAADLAWQPELWRALRAAIGVPSLAERLDPACAAVREDPGGVDLPQRLSVFGATRLPTAHLQVLAALGHARDVHLWLVDPSPGLWPPDPPASPGRRTSATSAVRNPLLRSLGRDARELAVRLQDRVPAATDEYLPTQLRDDTLLGHLQCALRDDRDPRATDRLVLAHDDHSLQVHACHGQARQAEVVHEVLLGLLAADPTLEARDILIMCPDLDAFAPLLSAAFCTTQSLRLRIADRTPEQSNTVLATLAALLDMVTGRLELSDLLDFAAQPGVRTRFGFDDEGLERLADLTEQAAIRWGLDDRTRADFLVRVPTGTWSWGLDRLLLGTALSEDGLPLVGGVLPVDDVNSGDVDLIGRLAELVTRLQYARDAFQGRHRVQEWVDLVGTALDDLVEMRGLDAWQLPNALGTLRALAEDAAAAGESPALSLADLRWLLRDVLTGRPTRSNFRSGDLTVCGLAPMRSVPHRVLCLVGMDDGAFPRTVIADGDDVMARDPLLGERDPRSEDRQVLLDAIMAATDYLVITYAGADERTNQQRPPCVPLGDLLDTVDAMAVTGAGDPAHTQVRVQHPLQPFDRRNFLPGALGSPGPFGHDRSALQAARRAAEPREPAPGLLMADLPPLPFDVMSPQDLGTFLTSPPKAYLRARLGLSLYEDDEAAAEQIPIEVKGLAKWQVGNRSLRLLTRGEPPQKVAGAERARGHLPPGALGEQTLRDVGGEALVIAQRFAEHANGPARQVGVALDLPGGVRVVGTVPDIHATAIVRATFSKAKPKDELRMWPELLALAVAQPERRWTACLIHHDGGFRLTAPPAEESRGLLAGLVELYRAGMCSPLPLFPATSCTYAKRRVEGKDHDHSRRAAQFGSWQRHAEERRLDEVVALWGEDAELEEILRESPRAGENWFDEDSRFGMLARRLWEPVLAAREDL